MGIVRVSTTMSLDGCIAGAGGDMDWVFEYGDDAPRDLIQEVIDSTGAIIAGRGSYDVGRRSSGIRRSPSSPATSERPSPPHGRPPTGATS